MTSRARPRKLPILLSSLACVAHVALASLNHSTPTQCENFTVSWDPSSPGTPPYELLLVPIGHQEPTETRRIIDLVEAGTTSDISVPLAFPAGSQFIATLSDATGAGSGGTSEVLTVGSGKSKSCLGTTQVKPDFYFYVNTPVPSQCTDWDISWPNRISDISLWIICPGGPTYSISTSSNTSSPSSLQNPLKRTLPPQALRHPGRQDGSLSSLEWLTNQASGSQIMLVAGDASTPGRRGVGGSTDLLTVLEGTKGDACLQQDPAPSPATMTFGPGSGGSLSTSASGPGGPTATSTTSSAPQSSSGTGNSGSGSDSGSMSGSASASARVTGSIALLLSLWISFVAFTSVL